MRHATNVDLVDGHIDVGRKYRQKQQEQAPRRRPSCFGDQQPDAAQDFCSARHVDEG